jgi:hypothetical protein
MNDRETSTRAEAPDPPRRRLLRFGTLIAAVTGASAVSAVAAHAAPGDKVQPNAYVPMAEKGAPSGVATLDSMSKLPATQLPDLAPIITPALSAAFARKDSAPISVTEFGAKGDGITDDTVAIQNVITSAPVGATVHFPHGSTFVLTATLTVTKRLNFTGGGELRWTAGVAGGAALEVTADGCTFDGIRMVNPNEMGNKTMSTARPYGISVKANEVKITRCHIELFQNAIGVEAAGERHEFIITNNRIKDVIGAGDGASNTTSTNGEDRGDGIVVWGASATITGNIVNAKAGTDARVGIHVEALGVYGRIPFVHKDAMAVIADNVVYGPFRRSVTNEELTNCSITGNTLADATWWAIAVPGGKNTVVSGNSIKWTRNATDLHGEAWAPKRGAFGVQNKLESCLIANNIVTVVGGATMPYGFVVIGTDEANQAFDLTLDGNQIIDVAGQMTTGVYLSNGASRVRVIRNKIVGFTSYGVYSYKSESPIIEGNALTGAAGGATKGIHLEASASSAIVRDNVLRNISTGIYAVNRADFLLVSGNTIVGATTGIDAFGCMGQIQLALNMFIGVTSEYQNVNRSITTFIGNAPRTGSVTWDPGAIANGSGETSPDIAVAGATVGDYVMVAPPLDMRGLTAFGYVSAAGIVKVRLNNNTGTTVDRGSAVWNVRVVNK